MKILTVNRNYFITGGPEKYMFSLMKNMPNHEFIPFCVNFKQNLETPYKRYFLDPPVRSDGVYFKDFKMSFPKKMRYAINSIYSVEARNKFETLIRKTKPDVAFFLNAVYFSDSIIDACREHNVPIIWRMSDFHKICANYFLFRDGHVCEDCLERGLLMAVKNRCAGYQRSLAAASIKFMAMEMSRFRRAYRYINKFVTPSEFTRQKMIQGGFSPEKIIHVPTFIDTDSIHPAPYPSSPSILYVGRITPEKGVDTLINAFLEMRNKGVVLVIAGDTSDDYARQIMNGVPVSARNRIRFLGFKNQQEVHRLYDECSLFVVPSLWYENLPNVVLEGMAHERPAVVSRLGSLIETVRDGETGCHFEAGSAQDLALKLDYLIEDIDIAKNMGHKARAHVAHSHALSAHVKKIDALFEGCLS
jgi:glycosyltransferase involved in cell wall biosynthesis